MSGRGAAAGGGHRGQPASQEEATGRSPYGKAATLAVACAEALRLRREAPAAQAFVAEIRDRLPRHRAFQDELKRAVQGMERAS